MGLKVALAQAAEMGWLEERFVSLVDVEHLGFGFVVFAVAVSLGIGMVHGLAPGHGKAIAAAYLVGSRGRPKDAVALGGIVSLMHTGSVLVLGLGLYLFTRVPAGADRIAPVMTLLAGVLIMVVGVGLVVRQVRLRRRVNAGSAPGSARSEDHAHQHVAGHAHGHEHGHAHSHRLPDGVSPLSRRGLVLLGVSGGLLPSPSAFLVLATALFVGRPVFGLLLVAAFSVGLALTLTAVGLATLRGRDFVSRRAATSPTVAKVAGVLPLVSAVGVLTGGAWLTTLAVLGL